MKKKEKEIKIEIDHLLIFLMKKRLRRIADREDDHQKLERAFQKSKKLGLTYGHLRDILFGLAHKKRWIALCFLMKKTKIRWEDKYELEKFLENKDNTTMKIVN